MLTQENVEKINELMEASGVLEGLDSKQAQAVIVDLLYTVDLIVEEHVSVLCPQ